MLVQKVQEAEKSEGMCCVSDSYVLTGEYFYDDKDSGWANHVCLRRVLDHTQSQIELTEMGKMKTRRVQARARMSRIFEWTALANHALSTTIPFEGEIREEFVALSPHIRSLGFFHSYVHEWNQSACIYA